MPWSDRRTDRSANTRIRFRSPQGLFLLTTREVCFILFASLTVRKEVADEKAGSGKRS